MIIIIPVHNQQQNIRIVLQAYLDQTVKPQRVVLVFDRCFDNSRELAERMISQYANQHVGLHMYDMSDLGYTSFGAGRTRDIGLAMAMQLGDGPFLFTDGDCVPGPDLVACHSKVLNVEQPRISCGRRYDMLGPNEVAKFPMVLDDAQDDLRNSADYTKNLICANMADRLVVNPTVFEKSWICWSCNLGMNKAAVTLCRTVNAVLNGDVERVFSSVFDGRWGGEDGFVGLSMFRCGGETLMLSEKAWVKHIWHERGHTNLEHLRLVARMDYELNRAIFENRIKVNPTAISVDFMIDRTNIDPHSLTRVRSVELGVVEARIAAILPDEPLIKIICGLCCAGYIKFIGSNSPMLIKEPADAREMDMLTYFVNEIMTLMYTVPFIIIGDSVCISMPINFDIIYEYVEETSK